MKQPGWVVPAALLVFSSHSASAAEAVPQTTDSYRLKQEFARDTGLIVEPDWHDLPPDAARFLEHVSKSFVDSKPGIANIGEDWSSGDFIVPNIPRAQHLFSAYSEKLTVSVFLVGGSKMTPYALVANRHAENYCIFRIPELGLTQLRLSAVRDLLRPNRHPTAGPSPKCQPQSLRYPLQLANPLD